VASRSPWAILSVLAAALAVISLDNTIVNVALPTLQEELGATTAELQWVVDAYSVLFAGTLTAALASLPAGWPWIVAGFGLAGAIATYIGTRA
jgi:MFS family permease